MLAGEYLPIGAYGLIGDGHSAALISKEASVDWACFPRFDSPSVFARLLDSHAGGYFRICPRGPFEIQQAYLPQTNVLRTTFTSERGVVSVTDWMPYWEGSPPHLLCRLVEGQEGQVETRLILSPRFDYGRSLGHPVLSPGLGATILTRRDGLHLLTDLHLRVEDGDVQASFPLRAGEKVRFVLRWVESPGTPLTAIDEADFDTWLELTQRFWRRWASTCAYHGPYQDAVQRSALVLKLLTYAPTGAPIAAPTASLPNVMGGEDNWDYRYTWLRDASLTVNSLLRLGYRKEVERFLEWLVRTTRSSGSDVQNIYTVVGGEDLTERELDHLEGYSHSRPVRIGNGAVGQPQWDIYGEVLESAYLLHLAGGIIEPGLWSLLRELANLAAARWSEPDRSFWEIRSGSRHFTFSKLMCWVALDRGINLARALALDFKNWERARGRIRASILEEAWNEEVGAFTMYYGSSSPDATLLAMPLVGFLPARHPKMRATIEYIERELVEEGLVRLCQGGRTFGLLTFWFPCCLARQGRLEEAREAFERALDCANHLGLFAERLDPRSKEHLGNFPQAFTHLALIDAAVELHRS